MSTEDLVKGILLGLGGATGIWGFFHHLRMRRLKKQILLGLLQNPKHPFGRTFGRLRDGIADSDGKATEELLLEIKARKEELPGTKPRDEVLWTLKPRP
jgi:hypothetical protein